LAARHPFRGAGFAGLRKASLWDSVGFTMIHLTPWRQL
jgi:hypothetical protein